MMYLFLHPEDVLLFRDGKPFNSGEDHHARSVFPPLPSVMQGAIRSHYLVTQKIPLNDKKLIEERVGTAVDYKNLRLRGPFVATWDGKNLTRYFPTPADAFRIDKDKSQVKPADWRENPSWNKKPGENNNSHAHLRLSPFKPEGLEQTKDKPAAWMSEIELQKYLNGGEAESTPESQLFNRETRLGIKLQSNSSRATEEGMLYQAEFIRACDNVGLYLEVSGYTDFPEKGLMRIGGEGHGVRFVSGIPAPQNWEVAASNPLPERFKIYFATPTYFEDGWQPADWGKFFEGEVRLEGVALSGSLVSSGFDYAQRQAKPARRFVPAGSVYYFSCVEQAHIKLKEGGMSDYAPQIGFGQILITEWKKEK
jgi:CRISPR-associated protein Cmr3